MVAMAQPAFKRCLRCQAVEPNLYAAVCSQCGYRYPQPQVVPIIPMVIPRRKFSVNPWVIGLGLLFLAPIAGTFLVGTYTAHARSTSQEDVKSQVANGLQLKGLTKGMYLSTVIEQVGEPLASDEVLDGDATVDVLKYAWPNGNTAYLKFRSRSLYDAYEFNNSPPALVPFPWTGKKAKYYQPGTDVVMFDGDPPDR